MKYCIWSNKGGVGKTFLTYALATEYARKNPEKYIVVIDMCPQANISEILLGGNGKGFKNFETILNQPNRQTIGGYFDKRISRPDEATKNESDFVIQVNHYAENLPKNLYLVAGDPSLELQVQSINQAASQDLPESRWKNVHCWLKDLQDGIFSKFNGNVVFFIDCNPSFATYTAQSIVASDRLIIPCTADGSSARAIENIGKLIYGIDVPKEYSKTNFFYKASQNQITLPNIYLVVLNRSTDNDKKPAKAFTAMFNNIKQKIQNLKNKKPEIFIQINDNTSTITGNLANMPDAHTIAIVSSYQAIPVCELKTTEYDLGGTTTKVNSQPLEKYKIAINDIIAKL